MLPYTISIIAHGKLRIGVQRGQPNLLHDARQQTNEDDHLTFDNMVLNRPGNVKS